MYLIFLIIGLTKQTIEFLHRLGLDLVDHVNVRLHGLVVAVPRPFHDNLWRYAHRKGMADERPATRMGTYQFPLGLDLVNALLSPEVCLTDHLIDSGKLTEFMQAVIHLLVRYDRQCLVFFKTYVSVSVQNALALLVQPLDSERPGFNRDGICIARNMECPAGCDPLSGIRRPLRKDDQTA